MLDLSQFTFIIKGTSLKLNMKFGQYDRQTIITFDCKKTSLDSFKETRKSMTLKTQLTLTFCFQRDYEEFITKNALKESSLG